MKYTISPSSCLLVLSILYSGQVGSAQTQSDWARLGSDGKLVYKALPSSDHIMDFSFAGYGGGGVAIPEVPAKIAINPGADDSAAIQKAIDQVSEMPLVNGHRGAVQLSAGVFNCNSTLNIKASGVVLRGVDGTILRLTGTPHVAIVAAGKRVAAPEDGSTSISDVYVPSGADGFSVVDVSELHTGDTISITRPVTKAWLALMGMDQLVRNGKPEKWISGTLETQRVIKRIDGNRITLTVPLSDNYDSHYLNPPGTIVAKMTVSGLISAVGIEHLRIESPPQAIAIVAPQFQALHLLDVTDAWVRDVEIIDTINSIDIGAGSSRVTIQRVDIKHTVATLGAAKPGDFGGTGTQMLFDHCSCTGDNLFYFATLGRTQGPNVVLNCTFHGNGHVQPHMRWSTGLLLDNCEVPRGSIDLMNRGIMGSGHGWTMGWGVAWNCTAKSFVIQQPPGAMNWAIGCRGTEKNEPMPGGTSEKVPNGIIDSPETPVTPASLYLEQLKERLGPQALKNIGY
jgi:hypothetical protein